jgi:hypothetical protein
VIGIKEVLAGVAAFFDGEWFHVEGVLPRKKVSGDRQDDECAPFDRCMIDQCGGDITGDDFHGTMYFHIGGSEYLAVAY